MKKNDLTRKLIAALICLTAALGASGCSASSDNGGDDGSKAAYAADSAEEAEEAVTSDGQKVEVYLDEDGTPYYIAEDGTKMMLFSMPFADDDEYEDYGDDEEYFDDYDYTENFIRGEYDVDGLKFTIPDGWFAENAFGAPMMFHDFEDGEEINYDETISIVPTEYVFEADADGAVTEDTLTDYFTELTDNGFYSDYTMLETGDITVAGIEAKYYDIYAEIKDEKDENGDEKIDSFRTRYIITSGDNSHCIILTALDSDESFQAIIETFGSFADTISLPTAEQMAQAFE